MIEWVQTATNINAATATSISATFTNPVTAGNTLIAVAQWGGITTRYSSFSDNQGNVWLFNGTARNDSTNNESSNAFYMVGCAGGSTTVTLTLTTSTPNLGLMIVELSGVSARSTSGSKIATANTTATDNITTSTVTTTLDGDELIGMFVNTGFSGTQFTPGTGFTTIGQASASSYAYFLMERKTQVTAGNAVATASLTAASRYIAHSITLTPSATVATTSKVTIDSTSYSTYGTGINSTSWSHTCSGNNRLLLVSVAMGKLSSSGVTTTATYNGVAMTSVGKVWGNNGTDGYVEMFYMVNPPTGTNTVAISSSALASLEAGAISLNNVDQNNPYSHLTTNFGNDTTPTVTVSSSTGNMVVDAVASGERILSTNGNTQTQRWLVNGDASTAAGNASMSTSPGSTSVTNSYVIPTDLWSIIGIDVNLAVDYIPAAWLYA